MHFSFIIFRQKLKTQKRKNHEIDISCNDRFQKEVDTIMQSTSMEIDKNQQVFNDFKEDAWKVTMWKTTAPEHKANVDLLSLIKTSVF